MLTTTDSPGARKRHSGSELFPLAARALSTRAATRALRAITVLAAGAHTGGFGCAAAFVDVADEPEDVPQPTRARPVSSPTITRTAWHEVVGLLRDSRAVSGAQCPLIKVSSDMKVVITLDPEAALQPAGRPGSFGGEDVGPSTASCPRAASSLAIRAHFGA